MKLSIISKYGVVLFLSAGTVVSANSAKISDPSAVTDQQELKRFARNEFTENHEKNRSASSPSIVKKSIVLQGNGLFDVGSELLGSNSEQALANLVSNLEKMDKLVAIEVIGHTDSSGKKKANLRISTQRAKSLQAFLQGAYPEITVDARGMGEADPLHSNATKKGRELNRRVEILVSVESKAETTAK